jgi:RNA-directed DNA polymerase
VYNRLSSGSYFPDAVKRHEIPKDERQNTHSGYPYHKGQGSPDGNNQRTRKIVEPSFISSFGYRPKRSAHQAIEQARKNCWQYAWVIDMDIKGFFDNIDHGLMIRALRYFTQTRST